MREMKDSNYGYLGIVPQSWKVDKIKYHLKALGMRNPGNAQVLSVYREYGVIPKDSRDDNHNVTSEDTSNYRYVRKGDFVINKMKAWQGSMAVSRYTGIVSPAYYVYKFTDDALNRGYFHYLLRSKLYAAEFARISGGIRVGQWDLSAYNFENTMLLIPPLEEQGKIATFLDSQCSEIDAIAADIQKEIETLEQYKRSVITEAVTKGLNSDVEMKDSGAEWIGEVPNNWNLGRIGGFYSLRNEKVSDKDYPPLSVTMKGILPQLETAAKTNDGDNRKLVRKGDFAINSRSDRRGSCGISKYDGSVSLINTVLTPRGEMSAAYYDWVFHCTRFSDEFYRQGHGIVDDLWTTGWQEMKKIIIPVPPFLEQNEIADYLESKCSDIDSVILQKNQQLETLSNYKKILIYEYVTGKKEVLI